LFHVIKDGDIAHSTLVRTALEEGGRENFEAIILAVKATGAREAAMKVATDEVARAKQALSVLPDTQYRDALIELSNFAVARDY
jgi:octaprenyl-diphosphate synthase